MLSANSSILRSVRSNRSRARVWTGGVFWRAPTGKAFAGVGTGQSQTFSCGTFVGKVGLTSKKDFAPPPPGVARARKVGPSRALRIQLLDQRVDRAIDLPRGGQPLRLDASSLARVPDRPRTEQRRVRLFFCIPLRFWAKGYKVALQHEGCKFGALGREGVMGMEWAATSHVATAKEDCRDRLQQRACERE